MREVLELLRPPFKDVLQVHVYYLAFTIVVLGSAQELKFTIIITGYVQNRMLLIPDATARYDHLVIRSFG